MWQQETIELAAEQIFCMQQRCTHEFYEQATTRPTKEEKAALTQSLVDMQIGFMYAFGFLYGFQDHQENFEAVEKLLEVKTQQFIDESRFPDMPPCPFIPEG